jgi:hypothetical protein
MYFIVALSGKWHQGFKEANNNKTTYFQFFALKKIFNLFFNIIYRDCGGFRCFLFMLIISVLDYFLTIKLLFLYIISGKIISSASSDATNNPFCLARNACLYFASICFLAFSASIHSGICL